MWWLVKTTALYYTLLVAYFLTGFSLTTIMRKVTTPLRPICAPKCGEYSHFIGRKTLTICTSNLRRVSFYVRFWKSPMLKTKLFFCHKTAIQQHLLLASWFHFFTDTVKYFLFSLSQNASKYHTIIVIYCLLWKIEK